MARNLREAQGADLHPRSIWLRHLRGKLSRVRLRLKRGFRRTDADRLGSEVERAARSDDWDKALAVVSEWAQKAERMGDPALLERAANDFRRLGHLRRSFELSARSKAQAGPKEWRGSSLAGRTLLVERRKGDFANFFLFLPAVALAMRQCSQCIVLVEERMAPLYRRTFPGADIRSEQDRAGAVAEADWVTSFEGAAFHLDWDGRQSITLKPDAELVRKLRQKYTTDHGSPILGLSWGSVNRFKEAPGLPDWIRMISVSDGSFVSLQYGDIAPVMRSFDSAIPGRVFVDPTVNQLVDMDRFAAQIGSVDAIVTISNTIAHAAGALGARTVVVLDGHFKRSWPARGREVPWYENTILLRKSSRTWIDVMREATEALRHDREAQGPERAGRPGQSASSAPANA